MEDACSSASQVFRTQLETASLYDYYFSFFIVFFFWHALFSSYKYIISGSENVFLIKKTKLHSCLLWASRDSVGEVVVSFHIWPGLACLLCSLHTTCTDVFLWVLLLYLSTLMCRK